MMKFYGKLYSSVDDSPLPDILENLSKNGHLWPLLDIFSMDPHIQNCKIKTA